MIKLWLLLFIAILGACSNDHFQYQKAMIDRVNSYHIGGGRFKTVGEYSFKFQEVEYTGRIEFKKGRSFSEDKIEKGDSVLIKFRPDKPEKSEVIRIVYRNCWIEVK
jgi:hypothetical protein